MWPYSVFCGSFKGTIRYTIIVDWLTHLPLDKIAVISQTIFSDAFFVNEKVNILIKISLKFVLVEGTIDNKPGLV